MLTYIVERYLPGVTVRELTALQCAVLEVTSRDGQGVGYLRSIFLPGECRCLCLFEAPDAAATKDVNDDARFTYSRILNALDVTPEDVMIQTRPPKLERM